MADDRPIRRPGIGIDSFGGQVIDPTANVLDLVHAAMRRQDDLRDEERRRVNERIDAETRRLNELAAQKLMFDLELAKVLRANQDAASTLLATQLKEVKNDLSDRTAKLEQFRWETGGKSQGFGSFGAIVFSAMSLIVAMGSLAALILRH
jgi:hypothetical protein